MIVTIDTNVLFQAFYSNRGASHEILRLVRHGEVSMAVSVPVFQEYRDVLSRAESRQALQLAPEDIETIMQFVAAVGRPTSIAYSWRPNLRDEADNMILELAVASGSDYLITQNTRDFLLDADLNNEDVRIVTPRQFVRTWRNRYGK